MRKSQILILVTICLFTFLLVYTPHFSYHFPVHVDEWHHITQAIYLKQGNHTLGMKGFEIGFHLFLATISYAFNLVLIYQFLPAMWAVFSALVLFFVVYKKTENNFYLALFSIIFFISIKSNVNLTGLWFFTPLTFSIPFIFLYFYFFTEAIEKQNKKYLLISLAIMAFLVFVHAISFLFSIPILVIYCLFNLKKVKYHWKTFLLFILIPILGLLFYKFLLNLSFSELIPHLVNQLQFKQGWGVIELNNSFLEIYSLIGYLLAILGVFGIFLFSDYKKYLAYLIWPLIMIISIFIYRFTGVSYLSPYQRNMYYFALSLPLLSAFGLYYCLEIIKNKIKSKETRQIILLIIILAIILFTFKSYFYIPNNIKLYKAINEDEFSALKFLSSLEKAKAIASISISTAMFPISQQEPVATSFFYGDKSKIKSFFNETDCSKRNDFLKKENITYIISKQEINCTWANNLDFKSNETWIYEYSIKT